MRTAARHARRRPAVPLFRPRHHRRSSRRAVHGASSPCRHPRTTRLKDSGRRGGDPVWNDSGMGALDRIRQKMVTDMEEVGGRHDEPEIYDGEPGDPGLAGGPGIISWEINGDLGVIGVAGSAAIIMEVLHPSVMAGVFTQSSYRTQPLQRARNTLGYVLRTTFGTTPGATGVIERVKRIHARVGRHPARRRGVPGARSRAHRLGPHLHPVGGHGGVRPLPPPADRPPRRTATSREQAVDRPHGRRRVGARVRRRARRLRRAMRPELAMNEQTRSSSASSPRGRSATRWRGDGSGPIAGWACGAR